MCHRNVGKENVIIKEDLFFLNVTTTVIPVIKVNGDERNMLYT